ncbi:AI-2E family transporter [Halosegnis sp.]|uniref:AI-2E family transporter n=1 Tax=Halosegnis sp. TaxID=2864959 RepID=UPI0035D50976
MDTRAGGHGRTAWWGLAAVLAGILVFVTYSFVGTLVVGLFLYYASRPVFRRLARHTRSRSLAAALSLLVLVLPLLLLVGYAAVVGLRELDRVSRQLGTVDLGPFERSLEPYLNATATLNGTTPEALLSDPNLVATLRELLTTGLGYAGFVGTGLLHLFVMLTVAFYLLRDGPRLGRWSMGRFADDAGVLDRYARAVDRDLYKVFSGNIFNAVVTAGIGAILYTLLNLLTIAGPDIPYPALVGLLAGAASLIPVVGMKLVYVPVSVYLFSVAYTSPNPAYALPITFLVVSFVIMDTIPDLMLRPYVAGRSLHIGLVMFAYIFGPLLFGWYGLFLGPLLLVVVVQFARLVLPELIAGTELRPFAVDPAAMGDPPAEPVEQHVEGSVETVAGGDESTTEIPSSYR